MTIPPQAMDVCESSDLHPEAIAQVAATMLDGETALHLADLFRLLGDPTRVRVLSALSVAGELCVCDLAAVLEMNESTISHQLRVLRGHNLVRFRKEGRTVFYALADDHVLKLFEQGLDHVLEG